MPPRRPLERVTQASKLPPDQTGLPIKLVSGEPHPIRESAGKLAIGMNLGRDDLF